MTSETSVSRLSAPLIALFLTFTAMYAPGHAAEDLRKVTVVSDKAKWTYFGDAFFNAALRRASNLKEAFFLARSLVSKRELREGFDPQIRKWPAEKRWSPCWSPAR